MDPPRRPRFPFRGFLSRISGNELTGGYGGYTTSALEDQNHVAVRGLIAALRQLGVAEGPDTHIMTQLRQTHLYELAFQGQGDVPDRNRRDIVALRKTLQHMDVEYGMSRYLEATRDGDQLRIDMAAATWADANDRFVARIMGAYRNTFASTLETGLLRGGNLQIGRLWEAATFNLFNMTRGNEMTETWHPPGYTVGQFGPHHLFDVHYYLPSLQRDAQLAAADAGLEHLERFFLLEQIGRRLDSINEDARPGIYDDVEEQLKPEYPLLPFWFHGEDNWRSWPPEEYADEVVARHDRREKERTEKEEKEKRQAAMEQEERIRERGARAAAEGRWQHRPLTRDEMDKRYRERTETEQEEVKRSKGEGAADTSRD